MKTAVKSGTGIWLSSLGMAGNTDRHGDLSLREDGRLVGDSCLVVVVGDGQKHGQARGPAPT
jgi:hypothetical protein